MVSSETGCYQNLTFWDAEGDLADWCARLPLIDTCLPAGGERVSPQRPQRPPLSSIIICNLGGEEGQRSSVELEEAFLERALPFRAGLLDLAEA